MGKMPDNENNSSKEYRNSHTSRNSRKLRQAGRSRGLKNNKRSAAAFKVVLLGVVLVIFVAFIMYFLIRTFVLRDVFSDNADVTVAQNEAIMTDEYGNRIYSEEEIKGRTDLSDDEKRLLGIRNSLESGISVLNTLREFFPDSLVVYSNSRYVFKDIDYSLKMNDFKTEEVRQDSSGEYTYERSGETISSKGIDISSHQGEIEWDLVAGDDVDFVFIRALYRGYESGKLVEDTEFKTNIEGATSHGIKAGAYIFTQAVTQAEVDEELDMLWGLLQNVDLELPIVVDVEEAGEGSGRMDQLSIAERTDLIKYYCESIKEAGFKPMIYYNINGALLMLDLKELEDYEKWFAVYDTQFYYPYAYSVWQYSNTGSVNGIEGNVDLNLSFKDF